MSWREERINNECKTAFHAMFLLVPSVECGKIDKWKAEMPLRWQESEYLVIKRFLLCTAIFNVRLEPDTLILVLFSSSLLIYETTLSFTNKARAPRRFTQITSFIISQAKRRLTLKSDSEAIKSSSSLVAVDALCAPCDEWLSALCDRAG